MHPLGLLPLLQSWAPEHAAVKLAIAIPSVVLLLLLHTLARSDKEHQVVPTLPLTSIGTVWPFFKNRFDFLRSGFLVTRQSVFQFNLLQNTVIAVSGELCRKDFFVCKGLDINEGFKVLSGAIPMLPGITSDLQARRIALIHKRLATVQNSDRLSNVIRYIVRDADKTLHSWGESGSIDPFSHIPAVLFQTTVRSLACHEIADDPLVVARLRNLYDRLDKSTTPASVLLPWLPSPSMLTKLYASKKVYDIVNGAIRARMTSGESRDDTLQMLLDHGDDKLVIVGFIMGLLVAGARSTGTTASWMITFIAGHPEWRRKTAEEVRTLLSDHSPEGEDCNSTVADKMTAIPLEAWENHTPVMDQIIREVLRLAQPHTAMRRNMGPETYVNGTRIPSGAYVVYPFGDVHLNPELYPDPWAFKPDRPERKLPFEYVGWGGGKTVCMGQRLAKLQLKIITALMVSTLDFKLVDRTGRLPDPLPQPNWNDALTCKPPSGSSYLQFVRASP
ncbi:cytochrome P450 [Irpex rosettiformis]|uniref:Cytochrome P450 n=1 Tax=Irpex rosettiformis TaxID=378272 RepID=A0ACB8U834_9APHY|nr:cytochrome P450 [Irpex rosettiformis]